VREVADVILGGGLDIFTRRCRLIEAEQCALTLYVLVGDRIVDGLPPLVALENITGHHALSLDRVI
jgi:hypothetical protein